MSAIERIGMIFVGLLIGFTVGVFSFHGGIEKMHLEWLELETRDCLLLWVPEDEHSASGKHLFCIPAEQFFAELK